jgi:HlyD family secretion protein
VRDREYEHNYYETQYGLAMEKLKRGEATQADVDGAWRNLLTAKEQLDAAHAEADQALTTAQQQVLKAGDALANAQADLQAAQTLPKGYDYRDEELAVEQSKLALTKAEAEYAAKLKPGNEDTQLSLLQNAVDQAEAALADLKSQQTGSKLVAPFDGKVTALNGRPGEQVAEYQTLLTVSDPSELQVRGDLMEGDLQKIAIGQRAEISVDWLPGQILQGTVVGVPSKSSSNSNGPVDSSVRIKVDWPERPPQIDSYVQASIVVREKQGVLKVPATAVRTVGRRTFVEYMDGKLRRSANVELGIVTEREAEVISGLQEGQVILAGQ